MTNRVGIAFLNRLLHRQGTESLKMKTLSEMCDRNGNDVISYHNQHARDILVEHHFDPDTGKPQDAADLNSLQENLRICQYARKEKLRSMIILISTTAVNKMGFRSR